MVIHITHLCHANNRCQKQFRIFSTSFLHSKFSQLKMTAMHGIPRLKADNDFPPFLSNHRPTPSSRQPIFNEIIMDYIPYFNDPTTIIIAIPTQSHNNFNIWMVCVISSINIYTFFQQIGLISRPLSPPNL